MSKQTKSFSKLSATRKQTRDEQERQATHIALLAAECCFLNAHGWMPHVPSGNGEVMWSRKPKLDKSLNFPMECLKQHTVNEAIIMVKKELGR